MNKILKITTALFAVLAFSNAHANVNIDTKASQFKWTASKKVGSKHFGKITLKSAKAKVEKDKIVSGEFVMDMTSFTVDDLEGEWETKFLGHVKSGDFFQVGKYPEAKLLITGQKGKGTVTGSLTIKKKTHPIDIKFTKKGNDYVGKMEFDRTKYDITYGSENYFKKLAADKIIEDKVQLEFTVKTGAAKKAKGQTKKK